MRIRAEQLEVFAPVAETAFERRVALYLREHHAAEVVTLAEGECAVEDLDDETLLGMARAGIARARAYGMSWESSITAFVVIMFVVAPNFDDHPLIRRTLEGEAVEPDLRVERLWELTTEENWEAAARDYDPGRWEPASEEV